MLPPHFIAKDTEFLKNVDPSNTMSGEKLLLF